MALSDTKAPAVMKKVRLLHQTNVKQRASRQYRPPPINVRVSRSMLSTTVTPHWVCTHVLDYQQRITPGKGERGGHKRQYAPMVVIHMEKRRTNCVRDRLGNVSESINSLSINRLAWFAFLQSDGVSSTETHIKARVPYGA